MFVIITYDVEEKRVNKVRKHLKKYLMWSQNSVFEGEITEGKLHKYLSELQRLIEKGADSIYIYNIKNPNNLNKQVYGIKKNIHELFL